MYLVTWTRNFLVNVNGCFCLRAQHNSEFMERLLEVVRKFPLVLKLKYRIDRIPRLDSLEPH